MVKLKLVDIAERKFSTALCFCGGGFRALSSLKILEAIEESFNKALVRKFGDFRFEAKEENRFPIHKIFDLLAGTSAGSIIATGIRLGLFPSEVIELFLKLGSKIFPKGIRKFWQGLLMRIGKGYGFSAPFYDIEPLRKFLYESFGNVTLEEINHEGNLLIVAMDRVNRVPVHFKSWKPEWRNLKVYLASAASSSAPVYFTMTKFEYEGKIYYLSDGGTTGANDPSDDAKSELKKLCPGKEMIIVSIGTGDKIDPIDGEQKMKEGPLEKLRNGDIPGILMSDPESSVRYKLREEIGSNFYHLNVPFLSSSESMDDASEEQIKRLLNDSEYYLKQSVTQFYIDSLVGKLIELVEVAA